MENKMAIDRVFTEQLKELSVKPPEKIKKLTACKGRHPYINKGNGLWKCNCGKQLQ